MNLSGWKLLTMLITTSIFLSHCPVQAAEKGPEISCDTPTWHFGEFDNTKTLEHVFLIKNSGDATLQIVDIRPSCGCTIAEISSRTIEPGSQATLKVRLSLAGLKGKILKNISIESTDPVTPKLELFLEGGAISKILIEPPILGFGAIAENSTATRVARLVAVKGMVFHIVNVVPQTPSISARSEAITSGKEYLIHVSIKGPLPKGRFDGYVTVVTDSKEMPMINLPISGSILGEVNVVPEEIVLLRRNSAVTRYVILSPGTAGAFGIVEVRPPTAGITANVQKFGKGYRIEMKGFVTSDDLHGRKLVIVTDNDKVRQIFVPIRVVSEDARLGASKENPDQHTTTKAASR
jgi:hypothetical protein